MFISLWTVPIVLRSLGASDYGLYNLIAGFVAMLSFINGSLAISTQRYMSIAIGENNTNRFTEIFNASIYLHLLLCIVLFMLFESCAPWLFDRFLNLTPDQEQTAQWLYQLTILGMILTIAAVPYDAVMNAHEDMLAFSIVSIIESVLRLLLALSLSLFIQERLIIYGIGLACISLICLAIKLFYSHTRYTGLNHQNIRTLDKSLFKEMFAFIGWNTYGAMAGVGRTQGIAIVLNLFWGTLINAAYGIANQINGVMNYFTSTIQKSLTPQIMQSEGQCHHKRMIRLSYQLSKYTSLLIGMIAIPLIIETPFLLKVWLGNAPHETDMFVRLILCIAMVNQFSTGIMTAMQSIGNMKKYQLTVGSIALLNIPVAYMLLKINLPAYYALLNVLLFDSIALLAKLCITNRAIPNFNVRKFVKEIILRIIVVLLTDAIILTAENMLIPESMFRLIAICSSSAIIVPTLAWFIVMDGNEHETFKGFSRDLILKLSSK